VAREKEVVRGLALLCLLGPIGCPVEESPAPATIEISPAEGVAGSTFPVTVRGTNTHFSAGTFSARFEGRGARVVDAADAVRVSGETAARLEVTIDDDATAGPRTLRIEAPPDSFVTTLEVRVPGDEPSLSLDPRLGGPGADLDLTLRGTSTHFEDGITTVIFPEGAGVTVLSVGATSPTDASARIRISPDAPAGVALVAVVTRDELVVDEFQIVTEAQATVSVDPPEGYAGRTVDVVVRGSRADFGQDGDEVTIAFEPGAGVEVSDLLVLSPTRLSARFLIAEQARAGFRRFRVGVHPADPEAEDRVFAGTFSVRAPGSPSVRVSPPFVHRGQIATLWLEGRGSTFDAALDARPEAGSGVELTGRWVLGPSAAALRVRVDDDAPLGTTSLSVDDGTTEDLVAPFEVLALDPSVLEAVPAAVETGAMDLEVTAQSPVPGFVALLTRAEAPARSGIAVRAVEVIDPRTAIVTIDIQETAPTGPTYLTLTTGAEVSTVPLNVTPAAGRGSITVEPPLIRAGLGPVDLVVTAHDVALGTAVVAELSDPALPPAHVTTDEEAGEVHMTLDVSRSATTGTAVLVLADGPTRLTTNLEVSSGTAPIVEAAPSSLEAGQVAQLVVAFGEGTSWLPDVTVAAAPVARGLSVDGLTVIDATTAILEVTVSSEAPAGPTGIVLATHGEISVAPLQIDPPPATPSITLDPPSVEPGLATTVAIHGTNVALSEGPIRVEFPESPEIRVVQSLVLDASTVEVHLEVDGETEPGTRPCELEAPGLVVRAGLAVRPAGTPAVWIEPSRIRRGRTTRLEARVDGLDLPAGSVTVTADQPEVIIGEVVVGKIADRAFVDVAVPSEVPFEAFWLTITAGADEARHRILLAPALPSANAGGASVEAGTAGTEVVIAGHETTFAPEETLVLPGASASALRFGASIVGSPGQLRVPVDVSAAADAELAQVLFVTGSELVAAGLGVRGATPTAFESPDRVSGSIPFDRGVLFAYSGDSGPLQVLSAEPDLPDEALEMSVLGPDGFAPLAGVVTDPAAIVLPLPEGALVRVQAVTPPPEGGDPLGFSLDARPLVPDAARELEPNDDLAAAELFPDPVECRDPESCPGVAPTFMACAFDPSGDRDVFVVPASTPVAFEVFARRLVPGSAGADVGMRAPWTTDLVAPSLGADLIAILDPGGLGDESSVSLEGLAGSIGSYLVVVRSAVVVGELGWTNPAGYIELRAAPGMVLEGFTVEIEDAAGQPLFPEVDLGQAEADASGLVLVSSLQVADVVVPDLAMPDDGAVVVRWQGTVVDAVAFGASNRWEGTPIDVGDAEAVERPLGIDRNDNSRDFVPAAPSPGGE